MLKEPRVGAIKGHPGDSFSLSRPYPVFLSSFLSFSLSLFSFLFLSLSLSLRPTGEHGLGAAISVGSSSREPVIKGSANTRGLNDS